MATRDILDKLLDVWEQDLCERSSIQERLHVPLSMKKQKPARMLLGLDHYASQGLAKTLGISTARSLYDYYTRNIDGDGLASMQKQLTSAMFSAKTAAAVLNVLAEVRTAEAGPGGTLKERLARRAPQPVIEDEPATDGVFMTQFVSDNGNGRSAVESKAEEPPPPAKDGFVGVYGDASFEPEPAAEPEVMIDTVPVPPEDPDALFSPLSTLVVVSPPHADAVGADLASLPGEDPVALAARRYIDACATAGTTPVSRFVRHLGDSEVNLSHFGIGATSMKHIADTLRSNPPLKALVLGDNWLHEDGGLEVARFIPLNTTLTLLDISDNSIGSASTAKILSSLSWNITLQSVCLRGNGITSAVGKQLGETLGRAVALTFLDLSFNRLGDSGAGAIAAGITAAPRLASLNLSWNNIGEMGSDSIARVLPKNPSLAHLDLSWNGVGESSGIRIGEALAVNTRLKRLNISSCRITYPVARVIADSLRFNTTLNTIDLSNNPLGEEGVAALLAAVTSGRTCIEKYSFSNTSISVGPSAQSAGYHKFDASNPDGNYHLDMSLPWDHAVAELLLKRAQETGGSWVNPKINGEQLQFKRLATGATPLPSSGFLSFLFMTGSLVFGKGSSKERVMKQKPAVHFELDLSNPVDHNTAVVLVERAIKEPGENWINETLDGVPFDFDEEAQGLPWIQCLHKGILSVDYVSTTLTHEASYSLDLVLTSDRALALTMLERVYRGSVAGGDGENAVELVEPRYNGEPLDLKSWRIGKQVGAMFVSAEEVHSTHSRNHWRLPLLGVFEFEVVSMNPCHLLSERYSFNLADERERLAALNMWLRALRNPGESWWNERIDGLPVQIRESAPGKPELPRRGQLEFDYVFVRPSDVSQNCVNTKHMLDLSVRAQRCLAKSMRMRALLSLQSARNILAKVSEVRPETSAGKRLAVKNGSHKRIQNVIGLNSSRPSSVAVTHSRSDPDAAGKPGGRGGKPSDKGVPVGTVRPDGKRRPSITAPASRGRRCSVDLVTAAGAGVSVELMGRNMREFAEASIPQRLLWLAGLPHNGDPVEDLDDDWSLDPWLYQDMDHTDEVLTDVKLDGVSIPVPLFLDSGWEWPAKGVWECQFLAFPTKKAITQTHYDALLAELRSQMHDIDRVSLVEIIAKGSGESLPSFTCEMGASIMQCCSSSMDMKMIADLLQPRVVDPHCLAVMKCALERVRAAERFLATFAGKK